MAGTYTNLLYHLVFSTKNRVPMIHESFQQDLYAYIGGIIRGEGGTLLEANGMPDHVKSTCEAKAREVRFRNPQANQSEIIKMVERRKNEVR
jgi:REP element-mobilizing transposase RayT